MHLSHTLVSHSYRNDVTVIVIPLAPRAIVLHLGLSVCLSACVNQKLLLQLTGFFLQNKDYTRGSDRTKLSFLSWFVRKNAR